MAVLGTSTYDNLIVGDNTVTDSGVLITGQDLLRGALLGKITASGKLTLSLSASADGSETPYAILNGDTDATSADTRCPIILSGEVNSGSVTFGTGHTAASTKDGLRTEGIIFKTAK